LVDNSVCVVLPIEYKIFRVRELPATLILPFNFNFIPLKEKSLKTG